MIPLTRLASRRVALVKPSALGDIAHSLPVLSALRLRFPHAHITWVVNRSFAPLLAGHPDLDAVLPFDRNAGRGGPWGAIVSAACFANELRRRRFDLVIDLQGLLRTGLMCAATGSPRRVGFANAREGATRFYTDLVPVPAADRLHAVDRYWKVVAALGGGDLPKRFRLPIAPAASAAIRAKLIGLPRPWLVLAVGSRWLTKRWPPAHFAELVRRAQASAGGSAVFVGSSDESSLAREAMAGLRGPALDLTGRTPLPELAAMLAEADVVLANDTGPLHLAAALGRPVVAPYTCTLTQRHGPYGRPAGGIETDVACKGSYLRRCDRLDCMRELTPDRLWPALREVLREWTERCRSA